MRTRTFRPTVEALDARIVPATLYVDDDGGQKAGAYTTIQAAVNAAALNNSVDTIQVFRGTYPEQVRVTESGLSLVAVGSSVLVTPPVGGATGNQILVTVTGGAKNVLIDGFQVSGLGGGVYAGIGVGGGASAVVSNNTVTAIGGTPAGGGQDGLGIVVSGADATVSNNTVAQFQKTGIAAFGPGRVTVSGNTVLGSGATATAAQNGIQASDGATATVSGNTVSNLLYLPAGTEAAGVLVKGAGAVVVTDNRLTGDEVGVLVENQTAGLVVSGNRVALSRLSGISLTDSAAAVVRGNTVTGVGDPAQAGGQFGWGVYLQNSTATVSGNGISQYQKGGVVAFGGTVTISNNTVTGSGPTDKIAQNGIQASAGANAVITGNTVTGNRYTPAGVEGSGVIVTGAGAVSVTDNKLDADEVGVLVEDQTGGLVVSGNRVTNSFLSGISLTRVGGGAVVRNNTVSGVGDSTQPGAQFGWGVYLERADATVSDNTISKYQKGGVVAFGPGTVFLTGNTVTGAGKTAVIAQNGIQASDGVNALISGNTVTGNVYTPAGTEAAGVIVVGAGVTTVLDNRLSGNEVGVLVEDQTAGLLVADNRVLGSTLDGISLTRTTGAVVAGNRVENSGRDGVRLVDTKFTAVLDNRVTGSGRWGVLLDGFSTNNLVAFNSLSGNGKAGVGVGPNATDNLVFGNG